MTAQKLHLLLSTLRRALIMIVKAIEEALDIPESKRIRRRDKEKER